MLEDLRLTEEYRAIKLFNQKTEDFHENLKSCKNNFVVIDNADILLDEEDRRFINFEYENQYMLFLRNCDGLNLSAVKEKLDVWQTVESPAKIKLWNC